MAELVDQTLGHLRFLDDAFLVVLTHGAAELVVVHGRPVLAAAPQLGHFRRVLDLEDALGAVDPLDARVGLGVVQQLLEELPEVNGLLAGAGAAMRSGGNMSGGVVRGGLHRACNTHTQKRPRSEYTL